MTVKYIKRPNLNNVGVSGKIVDKILACTDRNMTTRRRRVSYEKQMDVQDL